MITTLLKEIEGRQKNSNFNGNTNKIKKKTETVKNIDGDNSLIELGDKQGKETVITNIISIETRRGTRTVK